MSRTPFRKTRLSRAFNVRTKLTNTRHYLLAHGVGIEPATLSKALCGGSVKPGDQHFVRIGAQLGLLPDECFAQGDEEITTTIGAIANALGGER